MPCSYGETRGRRRAGLRYVPREYRNGLGRLDGAGARSSSPGDRGCLPGTRQHPTLSWHAQGSRRGLGGCRCFGRAHGRADPRLTTGIARRSRAYVQRAGCDVDVRSGDTAGSAKVNTIPVQSSPPTMQARPVQPCAPNSKPPANPATLDPIWYRRR